MNMFQKKVESGYATMLMQGFCLDFGHPSLGSSLLFGPCCQSSCCSCRSLPQRQAAEHWEILWTSGENKKNIAICWAPLLLLFQSPAWQKQHVATLQSMLRTHETVHWYSNHYFLSSWLFQAFLDGKVRIGKQCLAGWSFSVLLLLK